MVDFLVTFASYVSLRRDGKVVMKVVEFHSETGDSQSIFPSNKQPETIFCYLVRPFDQISRSEINEICFLVRVKRTTLTNDIGG